MLELIGKLAVSGIIGYIVFALSARLSEHLGWWKKLEIAAIIPMLIFAGLMAISAGTLTFYILS